MLADRVAAGELPPVAERLPRNPKLVEALPPDWLSPEVGSYGGSLRVSGMATQYDADGQMMHLEALLSSPGVVGQNLRPNILESFQANDAGTEFALTLREGLRWSDGTPVTTEDVRFAWEDVWSNAELAPTGPPPQYRAGGRPSGSPMLVEIVDTRAFKVSFSGSYGGFPAALGVQDWRSYDELLKPSHYLRRFHAKYANPQDLQTQALRSGLETWAEYFHYKDADSLAFMSERSLGMPKLTPWVLLETSDEGSVLERNPYYFKVDAAGNQLPYIDRIVYTVVPDEEALAVRQFAGEVDYASEAVVMPRLEHYRANSDSGNYNLKLGTLHRTCGVAFLNLSFDDPAWRTVVQDVRFREALSHAIDRADFIETLYYGLGEPSQLNPNDYDPDLASQLLDEMGMTERDGEGWRLDPEGNPFSIDFECAPVQYDTVPAAHLYAFYWDSVGVKCTVQTVDWETLQVRARANAQKATVLFEDSPLWFSQSFAWDWWGTLWNQWWSSGGEEGEEPPEEYKAFRSKVETIMAVAPDVGRGVVAPEVGQMLYEHIWYFVPALNLKRPRIESRGLGNVISNEQAFSIAQTAAMEQVFFRSSSAQDQTSS